MKLTINFIKIIVLSQHKTHQRHRSSFCHFHNHTADGQSCHNFGQNCRNYGHWDQNYVQNGHDHDDRGHSGQNDGLRYTHGVRVSVFSGSEETRGQGASLLL